MTLANGVTLIRIFLLPFFLKLVLSGEFHLAAMFFLLLVSTDWLDGFLARRWQQVSNLGKLLDPLADKVLVLGTLMAMIELGLVGTWPVLLLLVRELTMTTFRGAAATEGKVLPARQSGKLKSVLQYVAIFWLLMGWWGAQLLLWFAVGLSWWALASDKRLGRMSI